MAAPRAQDTGLPPEVRRIAVVVVVGAIMSILDTTIVNVALETLSRELDAPLSTIQWVATGYLLALSAVIPLTGWAAERVGARRVWMGAVSAFVVTSALCGIAWSAESLIVFRVFQGLAGGMIMPVGMITLAQAAGPQRMGRVMSVVGLPMLLAPVLGPVLGGLLVEHLSWRWIFFVNLPVGLVGLVLAARLLPHERAVGRGVPGAVPRLDVVGLALLSPGVAALVFGLSEFGTRGSLTPVVVWLPVLLGVAAIVAFVLHALRIDFALVEVRLFASRGFAAAGATVFLVGAGLFGSMLLLPLYYQVARGEAPFDAGLLVAPQGIGAAIGMNVGGRLTDRIGAGRVVLGGLALLTLGTLVFAFVAADTPYWLLTLGLVVRGIGLGATMMPAMAGAYATLQREAIPRATPMLNVVQRVGGALGTAILTVVLENQIESQVGGAAPGAGGAGAVPPAARERAAEPLAAAFAHTYWWALAIGALAALPALVLAREEGRARAARDESSADRPETGAVVAA
ncbi:MAG: DHA2 family efflux MFS transporter permease subunit [Solirubrobacterales bacterium]|nr:DHA2 family efflux MFS transporter permease subunit [Solirubrobacterales bacterium]